MFGCTLESFHCSGVINHCCFLCSEQKTSKITGGLRGKDKNYFKERNMFFSNSIVVLTYRRI